MRSAAAAAPSKQDPRSFHPRARLVASAIASAAISVANTSSAQAACQAPVQQGSSFVVTCPAVGVEQTFTVPANVSQLRIVAVGGDGPPFTGGRGARAEATIAVAAGAALFVEVGGNGGADGVGGFNGGGVGGAGNPDDGGGGGGGASDVRTCSKAGCAVTGFPSTDPRLIVGGGGGGGGCCVAGGSAGTPSPGGDGATTDVPGGGGATSVTLGAGGGGGFAGEPGLGGDGADGFSVLGGGAGGGGFFGGGGGGADNGGGSGGGGGSSYVTPAATSPAFGAGDGNPRVTFTYTPQAAPPPPPPAAPAPPPLVVTPPPPPASPIRSAVVQGAVKIKLPGSRVFVTLVPGSRIPLGSLVDASAPRSEATIIADVRRRGRPAITSAAVSLGRVRVVGPTRRDPRTLAMRLPLRTPQTCRRTQVAAAQARGRRNQKGRTQKARVKSKGAVRVVTGDAIVSTLGTVFTASESCIGTLVRVSKGVVAVDDLGRRKTVRVRSGRAYLAKRRGR